MLPEYIPPDILIRIINKRVLSPQEIKTIAKSIVIAHGKKSKHYQRMKMQSKMNVQANNKIQNVLEKLNKLRDKY